MTKNGRIQRPPAAKHHPKYVPDPDPVPVGDEKHPSFRFAHADGNKHCLHQWTKTEIKILVRRLGELEAKTWRQIKGSDGDGYVVLPNRKHLPMVPRSVSPDATFFHLRINKKHRIFCYRDAEGAICIVWFDRNHEIQPMS